MYKELLSVDEEENVDTFVDQLDCSGVDGVDPGQLHRDENPLNNNYVGIAVHGVAST